MPVSFTRNNLVPGAGERDVVQPFATALVNLLNQKKPNSKLMLHDRHNIPTFEGRKPDLVAYTRDGMSPFAIQVLGEIKGISAQLNFCAADKGQLLDFMRVFLETNLHRQRIVGFLLNGRNIQFFQMVRHNSGIVIHEYLVQPFLYPYNELEYMPGNGAAQLVAMLDWDGAEKLPLPEGVTEVTRMLGHGGAATVFAVKHKDYPNEGTDITLQWYMLIGY